MEAVAHCKAIIYVSIFWLLFALGLPIGVLGFGQLVAAAPRPCWLFQCFEVETPASGKICKQTFVWCKYQTMGTCPLQKLVVYSLDVDCIDCN